MKKQIARKYNISDAGFIEHSRTTAGNLQNNLSEFTTVDSSIDQAYVDELKSSINDAEAIESDEVTSDQQIQLTNIVKSKMKESIVHFNLIKYFAKKAFPENEAVQDEFGADDIADKKNKQSEMTKFMKNLTGKVLIYRQQLIDVSATDELLDNTQTLYDELVQAVSAQDLFISNRPVKTRNRITALNSVYDKLLPIYELSKIIFKDNLALLKLFLMPNKTASKKDTSIEVPAKGSLIVFDEGIIENIYIKLENTGETELAFAVSETHTEVPHENEFILDAGKEEVVRSNDMMNGSSGMLIVYNHTDKTAKFKALLLQ